MAHSNETAGIRSDTCARRITFREEITLADGVTTLPYLVQVPKARGKVMPEMASMRDDFPALCAPTTAMTGMSRSR